MIPKRPRPVRTVQAVDRAVHLLDLLAAHPEGLALSRLAQATGLLPQTAQSLLRTLEVHELAAQQGRGAPYTLGPHAHKLGGQWTRQNEGGVRARAAVVALARELSEYVVLAALRGRTLVGLLEATPDDQALVVVPGVELSGGLHAMATSKLLIAHLDDEARERLVASLDMEKTGPRAITNRDELRCQLAAIRRRGAAVCIEENGVGVAAAAVPVREASGRVAAALGVALPRVRFPASRRPEILRRLRQTAVEIERVWGRDPGSRP